MSSSNPNIIEQKERWARKMNSKAEAGYPLGEPVAAGAALTSGFLSSISAFVRTSHWENGGSKTAVWSRIRKPSLGKNSIGSLPPSALSINQYDAMSNRTSIQRDLGTADTYGYDAAQQLTSTVLSGASTTLGYDANGNRTSVNGGGTYTTNNLNQYSSFNGLVPSYDANGNLASYSNKSYIYDAQNRLITVKKGATTVEQFSYDGLNRQITRNLGGVITFNVWDGWNLIEERGTGNTLQNAYVYGAGEILEKITGTTPYFYYQDGSGNTSHLSDAAGNLLERYTYSGFGQPSFYNAAGAGILSSAYGTRHLFQGQLWTQETGLNDHRNRTALPAMGVFMQPDPIGFDGDPSNLYRYCGNNAVNWSDPLGLLTPRTSKKKDGHDGIDTYYGGEPYSPGSGLLEGVDESTMDRFTVGGPPEPGTSWAPGDRGPNDHGIGGGGGDGPGGGGGSRSGPSGGTNASDNPYLASAPFIAEIGQGFEEYNLQVNAAFWDEYVQWVPTFIPGFGSVSRGARGLITPAKYFGGKTAEELIEALTRKFGLPRSIRPGARTFYNPRSRRSFNVHTDPAHGPPHVDLRRRGGYNERTYFLED